MNRLIRVYATVSRFAERPHRFRAEFRDEMRSVSADATAEAAARGKVALWVLLWRELRDVPRHALCEQWRSIAARKGEAMSGGPGETNRAPATLAKALAGAGVLMLYPFVLAFAWTRSLRPLSEDASAYRAHARSTRRGRREPHHHESAGPVTATMRFMRDHWLQRKNG